MIGVSSLIRYFYTLQRRHCFENYQLYEINILLISCSRALEILIFRNRTRTPIKPKVYDGLEGEFIPQRVCKLLLASIIFDVQ